ncbi:MAG: STAS domain-containing protein [Planctomycetota bacterium]|jgi:anti-anti-sigma factor
MVEREQFLNATLEREGSFSALTFHGELANPLHQELDKAFAAALSPPCRALLVDLTEVQHIASFAVAAIGFNYKQLNEEDGLLVLVLEKEYQLKPFRLAGLDQILPVFSNREEAFQALKAQDLL